MRTKIYQAEKEIVLCKAMLNPKYKIPDLNRWKSLLKMWKFELAAYRHELNRIKGMDRVVVPKDVQKFLYAVHDFGTGYGIGFIGVCKCGAELNNVDCKYCPNCGKRILWEKVK